jgi:DNA-binding NarL/FixJ family response regulator
MDSAVIVITVAIVAQELTFADALAIRLDAEDDIKVVAVAKPSSGAVLGRYADVILLDADLGRDSANLLCDADSSLVNRVVMLSQTSEPEPIVEAVQAGTAAWIRKDESLEHLLEVLRAAARGRIWLPVAETGKVPPLLGHQHNATSDDELWAARLTLRERQVLDCLAGGAGRTHLQNIMAKLGVHSTLEAIAKVRSRAQSHSGDLPG